MSIGAIISLLIVGLVLGVVGRLILPGKQSIPIWLTIIAGIVGALVGTFLAGVFGVESTKGIDWIRIILQIIVATAAVAAAAAVWPRATSGR